MCAFFPSILLASAEDQFVFTFESTSCLFYFVRTIFSKIRCSVPLDKCKNNSNGLSETQQGRIRNQIQTKLARGVSVARTASCPLLAVCSTARKPLPLHVSKWAKLKCFQRRFRSFEVLSTLMFVRCSFSSSRLGLITY